MLGAGIGGAGWDPVRAIHTAMLRRWKAAMKKIVATATLLSLVSYAAPAKADNHLASLQVAHARVREANQRRSQDVATLHLILSNPAVRQAALMTHVDPDALTARLSILSDLELHDLADRARRLDADPVAGMSGWVKGPLIAFAAIGVIFVILIIAYATCDTCD